MTRASLGKTYCQQRVNDIEDNDSEAKGSFFVNYIFNYMHSNTCMHWCGIHTTWISLVIKLNTYIEYEKINNMEPLASRDYIAECQQHIL